MFSWAEAVVLECAEVGGAPVEDMAVVDAAVVEVGRGAENRVPKSKYRVRWDDKSFHPLRDTVEGSKAGVVAREEDCMLSWRSFNSS